MADMADIPDMANIPDHILSIIFKAADFDIDTRRALNMRPGDVKRYISKEAHENLFKFFETRVKQYKSPCEQTGDAIVYFEKTIESHDRSDHNISIDVWERPYKTRKDLKYVMRTFMSIQCKTISHTTLSSQSNSLIFCDVQTGEILLQ